MKSPERELLRRLKVAMQPEKLEIVREFLTDIRKDQHERTKTSCRLVAVYADTLTQSTPDIKMQIVEGIKKVEFLDTLQESSKTEKDVSK